jgi:hypothetical protein
MSNVRHGFFTVSAVMVTAGVLSLSLPRIVWAQATLENPQPGSFQSGIGVVSGWVCDAKQITLVFDGVHTFAAAYGTARGDTQATCGDTNNGFGLLVNWNLLGNGQHTVQGLRDGVACAHVTVTVTTFGEGAPAFRAAETCQLHLHLPRGGLASLGPQSPEPRMSPRASTDSFAQWGSRISA